MLIMNLNLKNKFIKLKELFVMNVSKSVARKTMMIILMVVALLAVSLSANASHVNAASNNSKVSVNYNRNNKQDRAAKYNDNGAQVTNHQFKKVNKNQNQNVQQPQSKQFNRIFKIAKSKLGDRYVWGGNGPHVFDCSGFTKYVYQHALHKTLPRLAGDQYYNYKHVSYRHGKAGDLVFFGSSRRNITHVGMYIGHGKMIDAQLRGVVIENVKAPWWHLVGMSRPANLR